MNSVTVAVISVMTAEGRSWRAFRNANQCALDGLALATFVIRLDVDQFPSRVDFYIGVVVSAIANVASYQLMLALEETNMINKLRRVGWGLFATGLVTAAQVMAAPPSATPRGTEGCGWGSGYGMGPGMMGGYGGGFEMGPGMMAGPGGAHGMGMMGPFGWDRLPDLNLTGDQRTKINRIVDETRKTHWSMMGELMDQQARLRDLYGAPKQDSAAIDEAYKKIGTLRQQMYDSSVDAHKRMESVLTKEQQDTLHKYWR
jgi:Spy/CpxP family protein refolding chaperone